MQSRMFGSEDLPLFSGQDYGPEDKGPFNPPEVQTQGSLLDMRPRMEADLREVFEAAAENANDPEWVAQPVIDIEAERTGLPPAGFNEDYGDTTTTIGQDAGDARQAELARMRELRGRGGHKDSTTGPDFNPANI